MNQPLLRSALATLMVLLATAGSHAQVAAGSQSLPSFGSITTPRPINPATSTTNPSARATQNLNPYLGSASDGKVIDEEIAISLADAISRGERFNLGLIDSQQADARVKAEREHAFSELLPQISARADETYQQLSLQSLGIKLPKSTGLTLPAVTGGYQYSEARIAAQSSIFNIRLIDRYKAQKAVEQASVLSTKDARDVVAFAVGAAYFQVVASESRLDAERVALKSAEELTRQVEDQFKAEVSPEIDVLKARVEWKTAQQRVVDAENELEKDKLTLDRITGIPLAQRWKLAAKYDSTSLSKDDAQTSQTSRWDVASLRQDVKAAELEVKAARAERLPDVSFGGSYGGGGQNPANYNKVYAVQGTVNLPIFTSGRIRSDIHLAEAALVQRRAEYQDIQGRVDYDVRTARLDLQSSASAVRVALENKGLADRALLQSQDRFKNGVTNYLEVLQAQEAQAAANDNYVASLFSFNVSKMSLARALGSVEDHIDQLFQTP